MRILVMNQQESVVGCVSLRLVKRSPPPRLGVLSANMVIWNSTGSETFTSQHAAALMESSSHTLRTTVFSRLLYWNFLKAPSGISWNKYPCVRSVVSLLARYKAQQRYGTSWLLLPGIGVIIKRMCLLFRNTLNNTLLLCSFYFEVNIAEHSGINQIYSLKLSSLL